ncbi:WD40 repeat domain-containing protein [Nonomuraea sp. NPDC050556]|uniref:WD40 repeat domain-containing protein n=1 Tax=Nonomuraea sp. NPDC050556 TaxID=3364369 RepID=UPI0037880C24
MTGDEDGVLRSWDLSTGKALATAKVTSITYMRSMAIQGGVAIVTGPDGEDDDRMERWDLATGAVTLGESGPSRLFELGGKTVTISSRDETLQVADLATGELIGHGWDEDDLLDHVAAVGRFRTTPILVIGDLDAMLTVWDLRTGKQLGKPFYGYGGGIKSLAVTTVRGKTIAVTTGSDDTIRMWDLATHRPFRAPLSCSCIEFSPMTTAMRNGKPVIVYGDVEHGVAVRDVATGKRVDDADILPTSHGGPAHLSVAGSRVGIPTQDGKAMLWDLSGDTYLRPISGAKSVDTVAVGDSLAATASGAQVQLWNPATGQPMGKPIMSKTAVESLAIGQVDGRSIVFVQGKFAPEWGSIHMWDAVTGKPYGKALRIHSPAMTVAHIGSRTVLVTGQADGTVIVWNPKTMEPLLPPFPGHHGAVTGVAVTTLDGKPIAVSGGDDGSIRVWDLTDLPPRRYPRRTAGTSVATILRERGEEHNQLFTCFITLFVDRAVNCTEHPNQLWELGQDLPQLSDHEGEEAETREHEECQGVPVHEVASAFISSSRTVTPCRARAS